MRLLNRGRYMARVAEGPADIRAAQELRHLAFRGVPGRDADRFDPACEHILVTDKKSDALVCCFRLMPLPDGTEIARSYSAQFYELSALESYDGAMVEMGRFCMAPDAHDPDILRVAWGAMTAYVDDNGVEMLFGCSSFHGTDAATYFDAFAMLKERHLAPHRWLPQVKAPQVFRFAERLRRKPDVKKAMTRMPPLLKTYLAMGGWVSDHAVVDHDLNTLHVFVGLQTGRVPAARWRALARLAG